MDRRLRRTVWIGLGMAALALVPAAQGCSFSEEPPGPGVFYVWDVTTGPLSVAVHQRGLGGMCELSNVHGVDAGRFAWVEGGRIRYVDLAGGGRGDVAWTGGPPQDLSVVDGAFLVRENTGQGSERMHKVWRVEASGATGLLHATPVFGRLHGPYYVTESGGVGIVDVRTGEETVPPRTAHERGYTGPEEPGFVGTDGRFLVYQATGAAYAVHDVETGSWRQLTWTEFQVGAEVAAGRLYTVRDGTLTLVDLATGARREATVPPVDLLGAGGGNVVFGAYSAADVQGSWRAPFAEHGAPLPLAILLAGLASVLGHDRSRRHRSSL